MEKRGSWPQEFACSRDTCPTAVLLATDLSSHDRLNPSAIVQHVYQTNIHHVVGEPVLVLGQVRRHHHQSFTSDDNVIVSRTRRPISVLLVNDMQLLWEFNCIRLRRGGEYCHHLSLEHGCILLVENGKGILRIIWGYIIMGKRILWTRWHGEREFPGVGINL